MSLIIHFWTLTTGIGRLSICIFPQRGQPIFGCGSHSTAGHRNARKQQHHERPLVHLVYDRQLYSDTSRTRYMHIVGWCELAVYTQTHMCCVCVVRRRFDDTLELSAQPICVLFKVLEFGILSYFERLNVFRPIATIFYDRVWTCRFKGSVSIPRYREMDMRFTRNDMRLRMNLTVQSLFIYKVNILWLLLKS